MKILNLHLRIAKIMKTYKFNVRITKTMRILKFQTRIQKNEKNRIQQQKKTNYEHPRIPCETHGNHGNLEFHMIVNKNNTKHRIPTRFTKIMIILEFFAKTMKILKTLEFRKRTMQKNENLRIPSEIQEIHANHILYCKNNENNENH